MPIKLGTTTIIPVGIVKAFLGDVKVWAKSSGKNLLNPATVPDENYFVNRNTGGLTIPSATGGTWRHSDYITVTGGADYYFGQINATASTAGMAWYDANQSFISGVNATALKNAGNILTAPANAAYMRHSWRIDAGYNTDWENTVYICVNGDLDHWVPYENTSDG